MRDKLVTPGHVPALRQLVFFSRSELKYSNQKRQLKPRIIPIMVQTYSYLKQRSATREWIFRKRLLVESTFALTMCQPWEKAIACTSFILCF